MVMQEGGEEKGIKWFVYLWAVFSRLERGRFGLSFELSLLDSVDGLEEIKHVQPSIDWYVFINN